MQGAKMNGSSLVISPTSKRLEGKVALITGGAGGIGEATARLFVAHGAKVVIADVQDDLGHSLCYELGYLIENHISFVHCDVTCESDVQNAVDATVSKHGKLDIMFSNAGVHGKLDGRISSFDPEEYRKVFDVNVLGAFLCAKHAERVMTPKKKGAIVFTSSVASLSHGDVTHLYAATKHALVGLTKNLCVELGQHGIRVNSVSPFAVATPMLRSAMKLSKEAVEKIASAAGNLKGVVLGAQDVAEAVLFLASEEAKYVSGLNLVVDGGYSTTNVSLRDSASKYILSSSMNAPS